MCVGNQSVENAVHDESRAVYLGAVVDIVECIGNDLAHVAHEVIGDGQYVLEGRDEYDRLGLAFGAQVDSHARADTPADQNDVTVLDTHVVLHEVVHAAGAVQQVLLRGVEVRERAVARLLHDQNIAVDAQCFLCPVQIL